MREHLFPILLFITVILVGGHELIKGLPARRTAGGFIAAAKPGMPADSVWQGPDADEIPRDNYSGKLIWYGHELIANTAYYLGPKGIISHSTNGMNCQNCHLKGGTVPFGNNFGKVYTTYPKFRARGNGIQTIYGRINDCLQRSLNGQALDTNSRELRAIYAYFKWLGNGQQKGEARKGTSIMQLAYLDRAADPHAGKKVYVNTCQRCHGDHGQGQTNPAGAGYAYPPLWGPHSYNDGAGLYRLGAFAGFVKNNMPYGADYHQPQLTDAEAWDVAAFVNSQPRPHFDQRNDWKDLRLKAIDAPYGPYADTFSAQQHKYGPWKPITAAKK